MTLTGASRIQPQARESVGLPFRTHNAAEALSGRGVDFDCVSPDSELGGYALVMAPGLHICRPETARKLESYVEGGGLLVLGPLGGMKDAENAVVDQSFPGVLSRLAGCTVEDADVFSARPGCTVEVTLPGGAVLKSRGIAEILSPAPGTTELATYRGPYYSGRAAATLHHIGKGACVYLGTVLDAAGLSEILLPLLSERGLGGRPWPTGVEVAARTGPLGTLYRFYLNHGPQSVQVEPVTKGVELLSGKRITRSLTLGPLGVAVIREE